MNLPNLAYSSPTRQPSFRFSPNFSEPDVTTNSTATELLRTRITSCFPFSAENFLWNKPFRHQTSKTNPPDRRPLPDLPGRTSERSSGLPTIRVPCTGRVQNDPRVSLRVTCAIPPICTFCEIGHELCTFSLPTGAGSGPGTRCWDSPKITEPYHPGRKPAGTNGKPAQNLRKNGKPAGTKRGGTRKSRSRGENEKGWNGTPSAKMAYRAKRWEHSQPGDGERKQTKRCRWRQTKRCE